MSRADYLARSREAGIYMQTFVRERIEDFSAQARGSSRHEGWHGVGVDETHNVAMFLWHYTDENFLNCRIPEDYGSPMALATALETLCNWLVHARDELQGLMETAGDDIIADTVYVTLEHVKATLFAAEETLGQLAEAAKELPGDGTAMFAATSPSPIERVQEVANRFADVVARMKKHRKGHTPISITDEYDVQYLFQGLLTVPFLDIRPEEPTPSVAGGSGRADTLLKPERIVVEYKCTHPGLVGKELRKQIADDFVLYGKHSECDRLFVFIYDPERQIANPIGFEADLTLTVDGLKEVRIAVRS